MRDPADLAWRADWIIAGRSGPVLGRAESRRWPADVADTDVGWLVSVPVAAWSRRLALGSRVVIAGAAGRIVAGRAVGGRRWLEVRRG